MAMSLASTEPPGARALAGAAGLARAEARPKTASAVIKLSWPMGRLGEGLEELSRRAGLHPTPGEPLVVPDQAMREGGEDLDRWVSWAADQLGIEAEPVHATVPGLEALLLGGGPAVLRFHDAEGPRFFLLLASRFGRPRLLGPDLQVRGCDLEALRSVLAAPQEARLAREIDRVLDVAQVPAGKRRKVAAFMVQDRLKATPIGGFLVLRLPATARFGAQVRQAGILPRIAGTAALSALVYALEILSWGVIGDAALNGRIDFGWLSAWILLVLSVVPIRLMTGWLSVGAAIDLGRLLKTRLLAGGLKTDIETIRSTGAGRLLARVMESQAFEALAINGGMAALMSVSELCFAVWLLAAGAGGWFHVILLFGWLGLTLVFGKSFYDCLAGWTTQRGGMTHALVERMIGHRTVLAQERGVHRDGREDRSMKDYVTASRDLDASVLPFFVGIPAGWTILGLIGLAPAFVSGSASATGLAVGVGGVLFAGRALGGVAGGAAAAARAVVAWREIGPLFTAARSDEAKHPFVSLRQAVPSPAQGEARSLVDAHGLFFRYPGRTQPVLNQAQLAIAHGERVLLQGGSGGGKSTLAAMLTGLRKPDSGLLLLNGLDRQTLGEAWHDFATKAPQFHENHILSGTLAFNLLMARNWPASDAEIAEAREVCEELGLGDLLQRMPAGMMQTVGETGWQLSHGERSRIFLARALLQDAPLTILDESFAALDPETLELCLACAFRRAGTLLVIAHP
jgi:ATP-binding cassette subfamily B protein